MKQSNIRQHRAGLRLWLVLTALVTAAALAGCGGEPAATPAPKPTAVPTASPTPEASPIPDTQASPAPDTEASPLPDDEVTPEASTLPEAAPEDETSLP